MIIFQATYVIVNHCYGMVGEDRLGRQLATMDGFPLPARANRAFAEQDYSTAISLYNEALEEDEDNCTLLW